MLLEAQGDAFPYLLMSLLLKIGQGLSALGLGIPEACPADSGGGRPLTSVLQGVHRGGGLSPPFPAPFLPPSLANT